MLIPADRHELAVAADGHAAPAGEPYVAARHPQPPKLLALTIYNPSMIVQYDYRSVGPYDVDDLKETLARAIDNDDDILTQFHDADELKELLANAKTFDGVLKVLRFAARES